MKEEGYYYAIDKGKTVIVEYRIEGCHGYLYMTGTDEMFAESEFDDVDFESCINVVLGSVSNQRELLIATLYGWKDYNEQGISIEDYVDEIESNL